MARQISVFGITVLKIPLPVKFGRRYDFQTQKICIRRKFVSRLRKCMVKVQGTSARREIVLVVQSRRG
jgi:hypothetical protein